MIAEITTNMVKKIAAERDKQFLSILSAFLGREATFEDFRDCSINISGNHTMLWHKGGFVGTITERTEFDFSGNSAKATTFFSFSPDRPILTPDN